MSSRLVFFDLKTTGLTPGRDVVSQVGAVAVGANLEPLEEFECKVVFDEKRVAREVLELTRYDSGVRKREALEPQAAAEEFSRFLRRHSSVTLPKRGGGAYTVAKMVAHNAMHDGLFLSSWFRKTGVFLPAHPQVLCTVARVVWLFDERPDLERPLNLRLGTLCDYFGVGFSEVLAHDGLEDARATAELYRFMSAVSEEQVAA